MGAKTEALRDWLSSPTPLFLDGAMGTELMAAGLDLSQETTASWNLLHPERVRAVHLSHLACGAQAIHTNSFGGHPEFLRARGVSVLEANREAGRLARQCAQEHENAPWVLASLGPSGLPPKADTAHAIRDGYALQLEALEGAVDGVHFETMSDPFEVELALAALRGTGLPGLISFCCLAREDDGGWHTSRDVPLSEMIDAALGGGAQALGCNCALGTEDMGALVAELRPHGLPVLAQPCFTESGADSSRLFAAGASAVGGCCGYGPQKLRPFFRAA